MLEKMKADILFNKLLKRPDINKAYAMVPPTDSWYDTITKVHTALREIQQLPHETLRISGCDGAGMQAVYYPGGSEVTVICAHGYTSHAEREWAFPGLFYHGLGFNVLIPYQRAHALSEGKYISFGALEHLDMLNWVDKVNEMHPQGQIVLHGLSMGGGIVLDMCDKEMRNVKCIISDAPSGSILGFFKSVSEEVFKKDGEKVVPYLCRRFKKELGVEAADCDRAQTVDGCRYPLLLAAGEREHCEAFFEELKAANPMETDILILPGCEHGNGMYKQTELFQSAIKDFIGRQINA